MATTPKAPLPDIGIDLDRAHRERVNRPNLAALKPPATITDAEADANSRAIGARYGASTSLDQPPIPYAPLRVEVPAYLNDVLRVKAAQEGVTRQYLVLRALADAGYEVRPEDLVSDRRKSPKKRA